MSERKTPHPGDIYAREDQNHAELAGRYPAQFSGENFGLSWPDGWHGLVAEVCAYAEQHQIPVQWVQIKEKFGGLRMYYDGGPVQADVHDSHGLLSFEQDSERARAIPGFHEKVKEAEADSLRTCCLCGTADPTAQVKQRSFSGWWLTACGACALLIQARHDAA